jgi:hypothetical protein
MSAIPNVPEVVLDQHEPNANAAAQHVRKTNGSAVHVEDLAVHDAAAAAATTTTITVPHTNGVATAPPWQLHDAPVENQRPIKVIVCGAGYSGVYLGIRIPERLRNCELVIYDKNAGIGGTWYENR